MLIFRALSSFLLLSVLQACFTLKPSYEHTEADESSSQNLPDLAVEPLPPAVALTQEYFRKSYAHLSAQQFQDKWVNAQTSGFMFMRSFVNTWYDELGKVSRQGPVGACLGDPHPENFGYLGFDIEGFRYVYNDADDSGACPVAFDALRYFTTLKFYVNDSALEAKLRRAYVRFLSGETVADRITLAGTPEWAAAQSKTLKKNTANRKIKYDATTLAVTSDIANRLFAAVQSNLPETKEFQLLDAARVVVSSGGSAGLDRYWVLMQDSTGGQQLLEFKQLVEPASQRGPWAASMRMDRAAVLALTWQNKKPTLFGFANFDGKNFLLRSRTKADVDVSGLSAERKQAVLMEQVYLIAQVHRKALVGNGLLEEWLAKQSEFMARRYAEALLAAKGR